MIKFTLIIITAFAVNIVVGEVRLEHLGPTGDIGVYVNDGLKGGTQTKCVLLHMDKDWADCGGDRPRNQYVGKRKNLEVYDQPYRYTVTVHWVDEVVGGRLQFQQIKLDSGKYGPLFAWRAIQGEHQILVKNPSTSDKQKKVWSMPLDGKPHTLVLEATWSDKPNGRTKAMMDGVVVYDAKGANAPPATADPIVLHGDFGLYANERLFNNTDEVNVYYCGVKKEKL